MGVVFFVRASSIPYFHQSGHPLHKESRNCQTAQGIPEIGIRGIAEVSGKSQPEPQTGQCSGSGTNRVDPVGQTQPRNAPVHKGGHAEKSHGPRGNPPTGPNGKRHHKGGSQHRVQTQTPCADETGSAPKVDAVTTVQLVSAVMRKQQIPEREFDPVIGPSCHALRLQADQVPFTEAARQWPDCSHIARAMTMYCSTVRASGRRSETGSFVRESTVPVSRYERPPAFNALRMVLRRWPNATLVRRLKWTRQHGSSRGGRRGTTFKTVA